MAAIFPPADKGGVPPGPNVVNGYTPNNTVIGEGPLYVAPDCTTVLTADQINAITSEILAAVDKLGFAFNTDRVNNLGEALAAVLTALENSKVDRAGDTMTGALVLPGEPTEDAQASNKRYVDLAALDLQNQLTQAIAAVTYSYQAADTQLQLNKVERSGDSMTGPLTLPADPTLPLQAATKAYVDAHSGGGGGGGFPDAPFDDTTYGRRNQAWTPVLPIAGGSLTGPLTLAAGSPAADADAAPKSYVDFNDNILRTNMMVRHDVPQNLAAVNQQRARQNIYAAPFDAMAYLGLQTNGSILVSQELGTVGTGGLNNAARYAADGWQFTVNYASSATAGAAQYADGPPGYSNCLRIVPGTVSGTLAATEYVLAQQYIEGYRIARLAWGTAGNASPVMLAFWVRAARAGLNAVSLRHPTVAHSCVLPYTIDAANTWEFKVLQVPPALVGVWQATNAAGLIVTFPAAVGANWQSTAPGAWNSESRFSAVGANDRLLAGDDFRFTGVGLYPGLEAPSAARAPLCQRFFDDELRTAQRYWEKSYDYGVAIGTATTVAAENCWDNGTTAMTSMKNVIFKVEKRAAPTVQSYATYNGAPGYVSDVQTNNSIASTRDNIGLARFRMHAVVTQGWYGHWSADARF